MQVTGATPVAPSAEWSDICLWNVDESIVGGYRRLAAAVRAEIVALTDPMETDQMGVVSAGGVTDITELKDRKVGTVDGYLWVADLKKYLGGSLQIYNSPHRRRGGQLRFRRSQRR